MDNAPKALREVTEPPCCNALLNWCPRHNFLWRKPKSSRRGLFTINSDPKARAAYHKVRRAYDALFLADTHELIAYENLQEHPDISSDFVHFLLVLEKRLKSRIFDEFSEQQREPLAETFRKFSMAVGDFDVAVPFFPPVSWAEVDTCEYCAQAKKADAQLQEIEQASGIKFCCYYTPSDFADADNYGRADRNKIALKNLISNLHRTAPEVERGSRRGRPPNRQADDALRALIDFFEAAGGKVEATMSKKTDAKPVTPFMKFLDAIWGLLPERVRLKNETAFRRRAVDVARHRRSPENERMQTRH